LGGFFFINNAVNGFIFSALALGPVLLAVIAGRGPAALRRLALVGVPIALWQGAGATWGRTSGGGSGLIKEVRFVEHLVGPSGILVTAGCPYPEAHYLSALPIFRISIAEPSERCLAPSLRAERAAGRIQRWLARGKTVYLAQGNLDDDFSSLMDLGGEKE